MRRFCDLARCAGRARKGSCGSFSLERIVLEDSTVKMASHKGNQSLSILTLKKALSELRTVSLAEDCFSVRACGWRVAGNVGISRINRFLRRDFKGQKKLL
jgi:hypothetical protein